MRVLQAIKKVMFSDVADNAFGTAKEHLQEQFTLERLLMSLILTSGVICSIFPVFNPKMDKFTKNALLVMGLAEIATFTIASKIREPKERAFKVLEDSDKKLIQGTLQSELAHDLSKNNIQSKRGIAAYIIENTPSWEWERWINEYGLHGLFEPPQQQIATVETQSLPAQSKPISIPSRQGSFEDIASTLIKAVDYSWLDSKFIAASKVVFGAKGSGKSRYLSYESIEFLRNHPDGELRIGDRHFDEDAEWLPGMPFELVQSKFVAKKSSDILKLFRYAGALLKHRVDNGIRVNHPDYFPFKLICDEFESFIADLDVDQKEEVMNVINRSQDEGRKFGINITLCVHSLKRERIGVDSSALFQMDVLCLGKSLADPNTRFPADFDCKRLLQQQNEMQQSLAPKQGYACVVRKLGEDPKIEVVPFIDLSLPEYQFAAKSDVQDSTDEPITEQPEDWELSVRSMLSYEENPTPEVLRKICKIVLNQDINDEQLQVLVKHFL
jgi:hypothetical protein